MKTLTVSVEVCRTGTNDLEVVSREFKYLIYLEDEVSFMVFRHEDDEQYPYLMYKGSCDKVADALESMEKWAKRMLVTEVMEHMLVEREI